MDICPLCNAGVIYRFNRSRSDAAPSTLYAYFCLADPDHVFADTAQRRFAS